jgi:hypothetical protein
LLVVPTQFSTLADALLRAFSSTTGQRFRIQLASQGPHVLAAQKYASNNVNFLSIEAASMTPHMGTFYGHQVGAYSLLGQQGLVDIGIAGCGPFNVVLSAGNTVITVTGTSELYPLGFGNGNVLAPGWVLGAPGVIQGVSPTFNAPGANLVPGDVLRWFDATTTLVTNYTVVSATGNSITVTPPISGTVVRGCGFCVRPRATVQVVNGALTPSFVFGGQMNVTGVHFASASTPPFPASLSFLMATVYFQQCLAHIEVMASAGANMFLMAPNTFMDDTNGVVKAQLWCNSSGAFHGFCQNYVGPSAGMRGRGGGKNTMCFSLWNVNALGASLTDSTTCKTDGAEFYKCTVGASLNGSSSMVQALWFSACGTGVILRNNSTIANSDITEYGPIPVLPLVFDGQGAGVGMDIDLNCQISTTKLRLRALTTQAISDGTPISIANVTNVPTLVSGAGVGSYGSHMCGITFTSSDNSL